MRTPLLLPLALCLMSLCATAAPPPPPATKPAAAKFDPFEGSKPLAVFIQTNPWAMIIGSDTPRVAIYENGDVIFLRKVKDRPAYYHVTLAKGEFENVRKQLKPLVAVKDLKPQYNVRPNATDQPEAMFYLRDGQRTVATSVYGLMAAETKLPAYTEFAGRLKPTFPPDELLKLHKWFCELDYPKAQPWVPKYVEVMLWDYSYAPEASILWPKDWPSLTSDRALKRGDSYSIFLDGALLPKLRDFLATRKEKGAVEIEGNKMAAEYRFTFPGERNWHKAFEEAAEPQEPEDKLQKQNEKGG